MFPKHGSVRSLWVEHELLMGFIILVGALQLTIV